MECIVTVSGAEFFAVRVKQNKGMPITEMGAVETQQTLKSRTQIVDHIAQWYKLRDY